MINRLVLDVLKPHEPGMEELTTGLLDRLDVDGITATLVEIDENVRTIRLVIKGSDLDLDRIQAEITDLGGSIHSVDQVSGGNEIVEDVPVRH